VKRERCVSPSYSLLFHEVGGRPPRFLKQNIDTESASPTKRTKSAIAWSPAAACTVELAYKPLHDFKCTKIDSMVKWKRCYCLVNTRCRYPTTAGRPGLPAPAKKTWMQLRPPLVHEVIELRLRCCSSSKRLLRAAQRSLWGLVQRSASKRKASRGAAPQRNRSP